MREAANRSLEFVPGNRAAFACKIFCSAMSDLTGIGSPLGPRAGPGGRADAPAFPWEWPHEASWASASSTDASRAISSTVDRRPAARSRSCTRRPTIRPGCCRDATTCSPRRRRDWHPLQRGHRPCPCGLTKARSRRGMSAGVFDIESLLGQSGLSGKANTAHDCDSAARDNAAMSDRMSETEEKLAFIRRVKQARRRASRPRNRSARSWGLVRASINITRRARPCPTVSSRSSSPQPASITNGCCPVRAKARRRSRYPATCQNAPSAAPGQKRPKTSHTHLGQIGLDQ
jgi:hypothetical protein